MFNVETLILNLSLFYLFKTRVFVGEVILICKSINSFYIPKNFID